MRLENVYGDMVFSPEYFYYCSEAIEDRVEGGGSTHRNFG